MNESDTSEKEVVGQSVNYSAVGKELLRVRLERNAADFGTRLAALGNIAKAGEFGYAELEELYELQERLSQTVRIVEDVGGLDEAKVAREALDGGEPQE